MEVKYYGNNQCAYCGKHESPNPDDGKEWWFGIDDDGNKICDECKK